LTVLLDPTSEQSPTIRPRLPRPEKLDGLTIGILDIAKARGDVFLKQLGERLGERGIRSSTMPSRPTRGWRHCPCGNRSPPKSTSSSKG